MNNIDYFNYSKEHPENPYSDWYTKNKIVIPPNPEENNQLTNAFRKLNECISTFNYLRNHGHVDINDSDIQSIINDIRILLMVPNINYTPFVQFFLTRGTNFSVYNNTKEEEKPRFIYDMLSSFCDHRYDLYEKHGYTNTILQVLSDNYSHKRNGQTGIKKYISLLEPYIVNHVKYKDKKRLRVYDDYFFLPDKGDGKLFDYFVQDFNLNMQSRLNEQGKRPDIVFKHDNRYYIMELKKMDVGGGGQNKQVVEIAQFINYSETSTAFHYITVLDGNFWQPLLNNTDPKSVKQREDILNALKNNSRNYFLNTEGTIRFFKEIFENA
ncbi:MAG: hypothetical protein IJJ00_04530 [Erysipelotrichaceae bacterium]|nr:hypothetical protein [Erysipelotrichaceae bacterium]